MSNTFDSVAQFRVGDRVQLHPATDAWMMGDMYGTVIKLGRELLNKWVAAKVAYDAARPTKDEPLSVGVVEAAKAFTETK